MWDKIKHLTKAKNNTFFYEHIKILDQVQICLQKYGLQAQNVLGICL